MSRNMIFHHQRSLARRLLHLRPIVTSFHDEGSVHAAAVSAHWSEGFSMELSGVQNNSTNTVFTASKV